MPVLLKQLLDNQFDGKEAIIEANYCEGCNGLSTIVQHSIIESNEILTVHLNPVSDSSKLH